MKIVYAHQHPAVRPEMSLFLAGPSPRGNEHHNWRPEALEHLSRSKFSGTVYVPLPEDGNWTDNYDAQVDWEIRYLDEATVIAFWIPRDLINLPGFTTNVEFGIFLRSGKIVLGYPTGAAKIKYLHRVAELENVPIRHELDKTLDQAVELAESRVHEFRA